tara:strand:- start:61 stop:375 length:315 start_codon:yes stop_codon:yes gene_type:complete
MTGVMDFLSTTVGTTVRGAESLLLQEWSKRMVQVSVYAGVVFYVLSTYELIGFVEKQLVSLGLKVGKDGTRLVHAVIFAVFMYYGSRLILDPVVSRVEGKPQKQ